MVDVPDGKWRLQVVKKILLAVEQEEKLCDEVETLRELTYQGGKVSTGGGCGLM